MWKPWEVPCISIGGLVGDKGTIPLLSTFHKWRNWAWGGRFQLSWDYTAHNERAGVSTRAYVLDLYSLDSDIQNAHFCLCGLSWKVIGIENIDF